MYIYDERFTKNIDKYGEGFTNFLSEAMNYYCNKNQYYAYQSTKYSFIFRSFIEK